MFEPSEEPETGDEPEQDPDVTAEEVARMPKDEIRALAQLKILENPCGE